MCVSLSRKRKKNVFFFFFLKPKTYKESTESKKMTVIRFLVHHFSGGEYEIAKIGTYERLIRVEELR